MRLTAMAVAGSRHDGDADLLSASRGVGLEPRPSVEGDPSLAFRHLEPDLPRRPGRDPPGSRGATGVRRRSLARARASEPKACRGGASFSGRLERRLVSRRTTSGGAPGRGRPGGSGRGPASGRVWGIRGARRRRTTGCNLRNVVAGRCGGADDE